MHTKGKVKIEYHPGEDSHRLAPTNSNCNGGYIIAGCHGKADKPNAMRLQALWNAADGMSTEEAVACIEKIKGIASGMVNNNIPEALAKIDILEGAMEGISLEDVLRYLEHGPEMAELLHYMWEHESVPYGSLVGNKIKVMLNKVQYRAKLEGGK